MPLPTSNVLFEVSVTLPATVRPPASVVVVLANAEFAVPQADVRFADVAAAFAVPQADVRFAVVAAAATDANIFAPDIITLDAFTLSDSVPPTEIVKLPPPVLKLILLATYSTRLVPVASKWILATFNVDIFHSYNVIIYLIFIVSIQHFLQCWIDFFILY